MLPYQSSSSVNLLVTSFMRWPVWTTLMFGSMLGTQYLPPQVIHSIAERCDQISNTSLKAQCRRVFERNW